MTRSLSGALSGEEIRRRTIQVGHLPSIDLVRIRGGKATIEILNPEFQDTEISARARGFRSMLGKFMKTVCYIYKFLATPILLTSSTQLPDMDFPINTKAEGRVLVPWEHQKFPNLTIQDSSGTFVCPFRPIFPMSYFRSWR